MRFFLLLVFVFLIVQAKEIDLNQVDDSKSKLLLFSTRTYTNLVKTIEKIRKDDEFIYVYFPDKKLYGIYIVNIDEKKLQEYQKYYKKYFSDLIKSNKKFNKSKKIISKEIIDRIKKVDTKEKKATKQLLKQRIVVSNNNKFIIGLKYYKNKQYQKAYDYFYDMFKRDLQNPRINFYLGLSAVKLKQYEKAVSAFERVLIKRPNHLRARLEFARALFYLKNYNESKKEFLKVLNNEKVPKKVARNIKYYLKVINKITKKKNYNIILMVGIKEDNNINNDVGTNTVINDNIGLPPTKGNDKKSTSILETMTMFNYNKKIGADYMDKTSILLFSQSYNNYHEKDILFLSIANGLDYYLKGKKITNKIHYDIVRLNNKAYLNSVGFNLSYSKKLDKKFMVGSVIELQRKSNLTNNNKDAIYKELSLFLKHKVNKFSMLDYKFLISKEKAKVPEENDNVRKYFSINYSKILSKKLSMKFGFKYAMTKYLKKGELFLRTRNDKQYNYNLNVTYKLNPRVMLNGTAIYIKNRSNRDANVYDKMVSGVNVMYVF